MSNHIEQLKDITGKEISIIREEGGIEYSLRVRVTDSELGVAVVLHDVQGREWDEGKPEPADWNAWHEGDSIVLEDEELAEASR